MPTTSDVVDALAQGLERVYPAVVFGRLNPGNDGFRAQLPEGTLYIVTVREADAPMIGDDIIACFQPSGIIEEDSADWLHGMSWGGFPENGDDFMEAMGWYNLPWTEQRKAAKEFMTYGRARHMPAAVKDHLIILGLLDEEAGASMFDDGEAEEV